MKKTLFFILLFELLIFNFSFSDTHYVSKTGTNVSPYTSWATAADSIQKAINAADFWDTVRVGSGTYKENIVLKKGLYLIGSGWDSTTIDGAGSGQYLVRLADSSSIEGFYLIARPTDGISVLGLNVSSTIIRKNKITAYQSFGISLSGAKNIIVKDNIIFNSYGGIVVDWYSSVLIENNYFEDNPIASNYFSSLSILNNIFDTRASSPAVDIRYGDTLVIKNNVIFNHKTGSVFAFQVGPDIGPPDTIMNNVVSGETNPKPFSLGVVIAGNGTVCVNNIVTGFEEGFQSWPSYNPIIKYNDAWGNKINFYNVVPDTGNISADPMFVNPDSDFHLQKYSPCIDAGDPDILDKDGTRSDIGAYGGPLGQSYTYLDYPPKAPDSLIASSDSVAITLTWKPNTEADLSHYLVYKDTVFNFIPDTFKIVGMVSKDSSLFKDYNWEYGKTYYYKLSAYDLTNHQSPYSDELMIKATDVPWTDEVKVEVKTYQLSQNYPNPFNPTTVIVYYLPDLGYQPAEVELTILNLLGKQVRTLVKERQHPGEHRAVWDGKDDEDNDVASGIYFYRLKVSGVDFVKAKKMVLIR